MQTIKCVVVGDGAVGKVRHSTPILLLISSLRVTIIAYKTLLLDLLAHFVHYQQVSK